MQQERSENHNSICIGKNYICGFKNGAVTRYLESVGLDKTIRQYDNQWCEMYSTPLQLKREGFQLYHYLNLSGKNFSIGSLNRETNGPPIHPIHLSFERRENSCS